MIRAALILALLYCLLFALGAVIAFAWHIWKGAENAARRTRLRHLSKVPNVQGLQAGVRARQTLGRGLSVVPPSDEAEGYE